MKNKTENLTPKQLLQYNQFQDRYCNAIIQDHDYVRIASFPSDAAFIFEHEYEKFEKIIQTAIDYRNAINSIKGVYSIEKYRRHNEDEIDYMGAYGEQLISYLNYRFNLSTMVDNYVQSNTAEYTLCKGCDMSFTYDNEVKNYEIKCTKNEYVNINNKALKHLVDNDCAIIVVQLDSNNNKTIIYKMTHQFFTNNAIKKDGQNGTYYYNFSLNKNYKN